MSSPERRGFSVAAARTKAAHFDKDGNPSVELLKAQDDRLKNWRLLQELAGCVKTLNWIFHHREHGEHRESEKNYKNPL